MTSPGAPLPWPPLGLELLRGRVLVIARRLGIANVLILAALAGFSLSTPVSGLQLAGSGLVCLGLAMIGSFMLVSAAFGVWRAVRDGGTNVWRGYTWLTIAEVMVDRAGDSGALIVGTDQFAELSPDTRNNLRIARVVSGVTRLGAGLLPLPVFFLLTAVGASSSGGMGLSLAIAIVPSLVLLGFASVAVNAESVALRPFHEAQRKRFDRRADAIKIADEWYGSFETARAGQSIGRGPGGGVLRAWAVGGVAAAAIVFVTLTFIPIWMLAWAGSAGAFAAGPVYNSIDRVDRYQFMRAYMPVADTTISPEQAGAALHALAGASSVAWIKPVKSIGQFPPRGDTLFRDNERGFNAWRGPRSPTVLDFAKRGLTPAQRDYLTAVESNKVWELFGTAARARRADVAAGTFILPFPAALSPLEIQTGRFAVTRELAYANTARATLRLANGDVWGAERDLRETVGVGFRLIDDGVSPMDPIMGAIVVGIGHDALLKFYTITNSPNLERFREYADAMRGASPGAYDPAHLLNSRSSPPAIRLEMLRARLVQGCGSVRGLLFGPSAGEQRELKSLRAQIARTPAEEAVFDLNADVLNRPISPAGRVGAIPAAILFSARISGALLRSPHLANCAAVLAYETRTFGGPR